MDPTETLAHIIAAIEETQKGVDNYRELLAEDLRNLADWVEKGGFLPDVKEALRRARA